MILSALKYSRNIGQSNEWSIVGRNDDFAYFQNINLLIGKNTSGKSRTLDVIRQVAGLLSGNISLQNSIYSTERFDLIFTVNNSDKYEYKLDYKDYKINQEILIFNSNEILNRSKNIFKDQSGNTIELNNSQIKDNELFITSKVLTQLYPHLSCLNSWGNSLRNYLVVKNVSKSELVSEYKHINDKDQNIDEPNILLYIINKGKEKFGETYLSAIESDMKELDYSISNIDIQDVGGEYSLCVDEEGILISQREMSQGMFYALSLLIMINYACLSKLSICLLVDNIGQGLDFESSRKLINILMHKIKDSNIQIFMATNDRDIMNEIPLKYWSVIDKENKKSVFYDYKNSKQNFDDFEFTGLNNFHFLSTDFYKTGFGVIDEDSF